ncbi:MAG: TetR/AcrR family transcriptional regulator [Lachnospiraceae bacterium]|nr:TetR/AcrR family transcriptional regulator [Lachnospiraceae bacterium]
MKYTRKPQQRRSIEKKDKIQAAAFVLFCEKGLENTNISEIAQYAGVATGTIYSAFRLKLQYFK